MMTQDKPPIKQLRQLLAKVLPLSKLQWVLVLLFSTVIYLSLGLGGHEAPVYRLTIDPAESSSGPVKIVFYGHHYKDYLASGALRIPASGWSALTLVDSTTLTAEVQATPLVIYSEGEPLEIGLLHYYAAGVARLVDGNNLVRLIDLRSTPETVPILTVGGERSEVHQSGTIHKKPSIYKVAGVFVLILALLTLIARMQLRQNAGGFDQPIIVKWSEIACYVLPLFAATTLVWLAFWPASTAHDGSLHWYHAVVRGNIEGTYGMTATLFMRLFSYISSSPAWVILFQSSLSALGIALILKELRHLGVPRWTAQIFAIAIAMLPQYPTFFNNLGKDALSAVGILFLVWSLLSITRNMKDGRLNYMSLAVAISAAVFAGVTRIDVAPTAAFTVMLTALFLYIHGRRATSLVFGVSFIVAMIFIPRIALLLSDERQSPNEYQQVQSKGGFAPSTIMSGFYTYHIFSAAVHSGIPLRASDEELFYRIAPRSAWANYDCFMTDTTTTSVSNGLLLSKSEYATYLYEHQGDMAAAVIRIIKDNPRILLNRQSCITKMLWYVGYGEKPFEAPTTMGYDAPISEYITIAGENKSLLPEGIRVSLQEYKGRSEDAQNFWLFWKPALLCYLGLFCVLFRLTVQRDSGLLLMLSVPLVLTVVLAVVIPFPAYRYAYPATLLMTLLCTLAFSRANYRPLKS